MNDERPAHATRITHADAAHRTDTNEIVVYLGHESHTERFVMTRRTAEVLAGRMMDPDPEESPTP